MKIRLETYNLLKYLSSRYESDKLKCVDLTLDPNLDFDNYTLFNPEKENPPIIDYYAQLESLILTIDKLWPNPTSEVTFNNITADILYSLYENKCVTLFHWLHVATRIIEHHAYFQKNDSFNSSSVRSI